MVKNPFAMQMMQAQSLGQEKPPGGGPGNPRRVTMSASDHSGYILPVSRDVSLPEMPSFSSSTQHHTLPQRNGHGDACILSLRPHTLPQPIEFTL